MGTEEEDNECSLFHESFWNGLDLLEGLSRSESSRSRWKSLGHYFKPSQPLLLSGHCCHYQFYAGSVNFVEVQLGCTVPTPCTSCFLLWGPLTPQHGTLVGTCSALMHVPPRSGWNWCLWGHHWATGTGANEEMLMYLCPPLCFLEGHQKKG